MSLKSFLPRLLHYIPWIGAGFFFFAILMMHHQLRSYHIAHIGNLIMSVSHWALAQTVLFTAAGYLILTCYDRIALYYEGKHIPLRRVLLGAFVSFAVSHNAGHALFSGTSLRYRFYLPCGLSWIEILKITVIGSITYGLGLSTLMLIAYSSQSYLLDYPIEVPGITLFIPVLAVAYVGYWFSVIWWKPVLTIKHVPLKLPGWRISIMQMLVGAGDITMSAMVLYTLLLQHMHVPISEFFVIYILSLVLGVFSQVPGGLGVFEGVFLHLLSSRYPSAGIVASLVLYRLIYYFLPLVVAGVLLFFHELRERKIGWRLWPVKKTQMPDSGGV